MTGKPERVIKAVNIIANKLQHLTPTGEIVEAMDLNSLPNSDTDFIEDITNRLDAIESLLNAVNDKLTILTSTLN
jgi:hypothetical protein